MSRFKNGDRIGKYVIVRLLGLGGFGESYLARDTRLDRPVAVKCLREDLRECLEGEEKLVKEFHARFRIEALAQARVNHPNACNIIDVDDKNKIIIMEYVEGQTLEERRKRGPLPKKELIDIVIGAAEAVVEAHRKRVLHRDLTLKNIMVTASNQVKVLDFGLAKLIDQPHFTKLATVLGTVPYMSPEQQMSPKTVDERSDVFSFGVSIYRLVTGYFPYSKVFALDPEPGQPPPFDSFAGIDPWPDLNLLVVDALQVKPEDRFRSMEEMLGKLIEARQSLARVNRSLHFFDSSTLLEVVCPPVPTSAGQRRSKRAQHQFEVQHASDSAVTSGSVMAELLDRVFRLYFEAKERGLKKNPEVQRVVKNAKNVYGIGSGQSSWEGLNPKYKMRFAFRARSLFLDKLQAIASQLAIVEANNHTLLLKFLHLSELTIKLQFPEEFPKRDARILAEAFSLQSGWLYSEEKRYRRKPYKRILDSLGPNHYRLLDRAPLIGNPSKGASPASAPPPQPTERTASL